MRTVVADANALIMPFEFSVNIDTELARILGGYEIVVPAPIIGELEKLAAGNRKANMALSLARTKTVVESAESGDMSVLDIAGRMDGIILTNDRELISLAAERGIPVIRLMGGKKLGFEGGTEPTK